MKKLLVLVLLLPGSLVAQSAFDGTWVGKIESAQLPKKPEVYVLNKGMYKCSTCVPKVNVKAGGQDQKVPGSNYFDSINVRLVNDNVVEFTNKKNGKTVATETDTISSDGKTLTQKFEDVSEAQPVNGEVILLRVSNGPAGSHALSGSWRTDKINDFSKNALTVTYQSSSDGLKMSSPVGESFDAKFDGKDYPIEGESGQTMISLKRVDANNIEATYKRNGRVTGTSRMTVAPDGKSIHVVFNSKERGTTTSYDLEKQS